MSPTKALICPAIVNVHLGIPHLPQTPASSRYLASCPHSMSSVLLSNLRRNTLRYFYCLHPHHQIQCKYLEPELSSVGCSPGLFTVCSLGNGPAFRELISCLITLLSLLSSLKGFLVLRTQTPGWSPRPHISSPHSNKVVFPFWKGSVPYFQ